MESFIAKTSVFKYLKIYIICVLLCWLIIPIFVLIYHIMLAKSEKYVFNGCSYKIERGVFSKKTTNREITKVLAVNKEQSPLGVMLNYGNVFCQTPEGFGASFDFISKPEELKEYLESINNKNKKALMEEI